MYVPLSPLKFMHTQVHISKLTNVKAKYMNNAIYSLEVRSCVFDDGLLPELIPLSHSMGYCDAPLYERLCPLQCLLQYVQETAIIDIAERAMIKMEGKDRRTRKVTN